MRENEVVVVANRLPVTSERLPDGTTETRLAPGGLVSALLPAAMSLGCTWVGWHAGADHPALSDTPIRLSGVPLSDAELAGYYLGFSNSVLWPLFHGQPSLIVEEPGWWEAYRAVNERFARAAVKEAAPGATVWVHDYHLLLVPALVRHLRPDLDVRFFLHIPMPEAGDILRFPWGGALAAGLLAAHRIGVQREADAVRLREVQRVLRVGAEPGWSGSEAERGAKAGVRAETEVGAGPIVAWLPDEAQIECAPITIDAGLVQQAAVSSGESGAPARLRARLGIAAHPMLLSVDRLDYTKGIPERLRAFEALLGRRRHADPPPVLVQVLTPTRTEIAAYRALAAEVEHLTDRINRRFGEPGWQPVVTVSGNFDLDDLVAYYLAADVLCVTPLRDGMNLVVKEFIAARTDERGVVVLSTEAGAADELAEVIPVDPHDPVALTEALAAALSLAADLPPGAHTARMRALRERVLGHSVQEWAQGLLSVRQP